jgi:hypothetical protein
LGRTSRAAAPRGAIRAAGLAWRRGACRSEEGGFSGGRARASQLAPWLTVASFVQKAGTLFRRRSNHSRLDRVIIRGWTAGRLKAGLRAYAAVARAGGGVRALRGALRRKKLARGGQLAPGWGFPSSFVVLYMRSLFLSVVVVEKPFVVQAFRMAWGTEARTRRAYERSRGVGGEKSHAPCWCHLLLNSSLFARR